ncbi:MULTISPECIES: hypothetical protein [unclassified Halomonas]|nr:MULTISPECIES: hypothetical protein [unclassified Halomonas]
MADANDRDAFHEQLIERIEQLEEEKQALLDQLETYQQKEAEDAV